MRKVFKIAGSVNESHNNASISACLARMGIIVLFSVALLLTLFNLASASGQTVSLLPQDQVEMESETASMGASCNIKTEHNYKSIDSIKASGTQPLSNLPIGARVVDQSWEWQFRNGNNYSGASETKPVTWIVVAKNHYGANSGVTLISEELIGLHLFDDSTNRGSSWGSNHWGDSGTNNATRGSRTFLNSIGIDAWTGFYFAFPESFISNIITTAVPNKIWDTGISYSTQDKVFIPSTTELGDTSHSSTYQIGTVYPYFEDSTDADRLAKLDGINRFYFTRSPGSTHAGVLRSVGSGGSFNDNSADNSSGGLRPAINMQSETPVSISPNADGSYSFSAEIDPIPASDADLSTLGINPGVLSPTFERDVINYTVTVAHDIGTIEIIAILSDANASLTIGGATVSSGATETVSLGSPGTATVIEIEVIAEDETTRKTYTITVNRATESEDPPTWTSGLYDSHDGVFHLRGLAPFRFGPRGSSWLPVAGDWSGSGDDDIGLYDPADGVFHLHSLAPFRYGPRGSSWLPVAGDWSGSGTESVGLYDPADGVFHLHGLAPFRFGPRGSSWLPVAGDWNGSGTESVGLYDPADGVFHLHGSAPFRFGPRGSSWLPVAGDWNGSGTESVGLYDPADGVFHFQGLTPFRFGPRSSSWLPLAGHW